MAGVVAAGEAVFLIALVNFAAAGLVVFAYTFLAIFIIFFFIIYLLKLINTKLKTVINKFIFFV